MFIGTAGFRLVPTKGGRRANRRQLVIAFSGGSMDRTRRTFLQRAALFSGGVLTAGRAATGQQDQHTGHEQMPMPPGMQMDHSNTDMEATASLPVMTPDVPDLPFELDKGVKAFHLVAEPVKREIFPGRVIDLWGYNG